MFTGIIEDVGVVKRVERKRKDVELTIEVRGERGGRGGMDISDVELGESISVNGTCLTVTSRDAVTFTVSASEETLAKTTLSTLKTGSGVNLERALRVGGRMGGHIVQGHVDGVGRVESIRGRGESLVFWFAVPGEISRYVVAKGSVAVDGVSLTVNEVKRGAFSVNIIPFTQEATIFSSYKPGDGVNIECDVLGKYVEKFLGLKREGGEESEKSGADERLSSLLEKL